MGLFDFFNSDLFSQKEQQPNEFKPGYSNALIGLGAGLLGSGGYSTMPMSGGQAWAQGLQGMQQGMAQDRAQALQGFQVQHLNSQMDIEKQRAELLKKQIEQQAAKDRIGQMLLGMGTMSPEQQLAANADAGTPGPRANAMPVNGFGGGQFDISKATPNQLLGLKMMGFDPVDVYNATQPKAVQAGSYQRDASGNMSYVTDPTKGLTFDPKTGAVGVAPGFLQSNAAIKGGEAGAVKQAELPAQIALAGANKQIELGAASAIAQLGRAGTLAAENQPIQYQTATGVKVAPAGAVKDLATKAAEETNKSDKVIGLLDGIEKTISGATGSAAGAGIDAALGAFGYSLPGANNIAKLKATEGALLMAMPRMEGPQSNIDVANYKAAAGAIADPMVPREQKIAALQTVRQIYGKYASQQPQGNNSSADPLGIR